MVMKKLLDGNTERGYDRKEERQKLSAKAKKTSWHSFDERLR
jgi:hypothetical protein